MTTSPSAISAPTRVSQAAVVLCANTYRIRARVRQDASAIRKGTLHSHPKELLCLVLICGVSFRKLHDLRPFWSQRRPEYCLASIPQQTAKPHVEEVGQIGVRNCIVIRRIGESCNQRIVANTLFECASTNNKSRTHGRGWRLAITRANPIETARPVTCHRSERIAFSSNPRSWPALVFQTCERETRLRATTDREWNCSRPAFPKRAKGIRQPHDSSPVVLIAVHCDGSLNATSQRQLNVKSCRLLNSFDQLSSP